MIILALDLGSPATKTAATILDTDSGVIQRTSFATTPEQFLRHLELYQRIVHQRVGASRVAAVAP